MNIDEKIDSLLTKYCYIIDIFPARVEENKKGYYFQLEQYFKKRKELKHIRSQFTRIILKLLCYFDAEIYWDHQPLPINCTAIETSIKKSIARNKGILYILLFKEDVLLQFCGDDLYISIYHCTSKVEEILKPIVLSEGLFWRKGFREN